MGKHDKDYTLFQFDFTPTVCKGPHQEYLLMGNVRICLEFRQALAMPTMFVCYTEYGNLVSIFKSRQFLKNY